MGVRAAGKRDRRTLLFHVYTSPDKTYMACKLPGETARCAREGRKHALYNNSKNNATPATQHANFLHANGSREGAHRSNGAVYLALLCVHLLVDLYCLKREYIRLTVAADVFHGRLPNSTVMPLRPIPASFSLTRRGINDTASSCAYFVRIQIF